MNHSGIKLPLKAGHGLSGVWIQDANGLTLFDVNPPLIADEDDEDLLFEIAQEMVAAYNLKLTRDEDGK